MIKKITVWQGDITTLNVDAIVNAANSSLLGGGGIDGAIHAAAGPELLEECRKLDGCETGEAKITKGYALPAKYVIHTVGPIYSAHEIQESKRLLRNCYTNCLILADEHKLKSIAFPAISTGAFGFPPEYAIENALLSLRRYLVLHETANTTSLEEVFLVAFSEDDEELFKQKLPDMRRFLNPSDGSRFVGAGDDIVVTRS